MPIPIVVLLEVVEVDVEHGERPAMHELSGMLLVALALVAAGVLIMVLDGITKKSLVAGPILIAIGAGWYGHFDLGWHSRLVIPLVMIFSGLMMLVARFAPVPDTRIRGVFAPRERDGA